MDLQGRDRPREIARQRDNHTCRICLNKWVEGQRRFDIHHLSGFCGKLSRKYDKIDNLEMLITLCHKCHLNLETVKVKMKNAVRKPRKTMLFTLNSTDKRRKIIQKHAETYNFVLESRHKRLTFREIGQLLGVSRQRIYQIYKGYPLTINKQNQTKND